eukprot:XP_020398785.1 uncharacterized protein LOC109941932 [Zea mays]
MCVMFVGLSQTDDNTWIIFVGLIQTDENMSRRRPPAVAEVAAPRPHARPPELAAPRPPARPPERAVAPRLPARARRAAPARRRPALATRSPRSPRVAPARAHRAAPARPRPALASLAVPPAALAPLTRSALARPPAKKLALRRTQPTCLRRAASNTPAREEGRLWPSSRRREPAVHPRRARHPSTPPSFPAVSLHVSLLHLMHMAAMACM